MRDFRCHVSLSECLVHSLLVVSAPFWFHGRWHFSCPSLPKNQSRTSRRWPALWWCLQTTRWCQQALTCLQRSMSEQWPEQWPKPQLTSYNHQMPGWWFGCHQFYFPRNIGFRLSSQLTNSIIFQRGGPTTNQMQYLETTRNGGISFIIRGLVSVFAQLVLVVQYLLVYCENLELFSWWESRNPQSSIFRDGIWGFKHYSNACKSALKHDLGGHFEGKKMDETGGQSVVKRSTRVSDPFAGTNTEEQQLRYRSCWVLRSKNWALTWPDFDGIQCRCHWWWP